MVAIATGISPDQHNIYPRNKAVDAQLNWSTSAVAFEFRRTVLYVKIQ